MEINLSTHWKTTRALSSFIEITCPIHGKKRQKAKEHLASTTGCFKCGVELRGKLKSEKYSRSFIQNCIELHGEKYDYSKTICNSSKDQITVICKKHGEFPIMAANHLGAGHCGKCADELNGLNKRLSLEEFIQKAHIIHYNKYDYSKTVIGRQGEKALINCPVHGRFEQDRNSHLQGHGCPSCAGDNKGRDSYWNFVTDIDWANTKCYLYLATKDDYLKIGISNQLQRRSNQVDYDEYLETWESTRAICFTIERYLLKQTAYAAIPENKPQ